MSWTLVDLSSSFHEDAPRPPVPGQEGHAPPPCCPSSRPVMRSRSSRGEDGLGEPEGSASPDSPRTRWTKSLLSLLGDQDGAQLFRTFLERDKHVDTLDFWFACNGFRQMDINNTKTLRVAKAIYKRYIENSSVVAKQLKAATKSYIRDVIRRQQIDSAMFDQAQTEIQSSMEDSAYQNFLTSDIYLEYIHSGGENGAYMQPIANLKVCGYLPTLNEEEEWTYNDLKTRTVTSVVGLSPESLSATISSRSNEVTENTYRPCRVGDSSSPYHSGSSYGFAPATSANDSEISSDALTDDSLSMTEGSVDGIPPYRLGSRKHMQREMHRSVKVNGQVSLPHFPRTHRLPKEMTPVKPAAFAAELIARLEKLRREQETMSCLEERLQKIKEEEEKDEPDAPCNGQALRDSSNSYHRTHSLGLLSPGSCEDDPQAILDEHLSRVLKTPGCQSPGVGRHSPRSRSPDHHLHRAATAKRLSLMGSAPCTTYPVGCSGKTFISKQSSKHVHHHYVHHHSVPKSKEQIEVEAAQRVQCLCPGSPDCCSYPRCRNHLKEQCLGPPEAFTMGRPGVLSKRNCRIGEGFVLSGSEVISSSTTLQLPSDGTDRSQNVWQWMIESERQSRHKMHSAGGPKKALGGTGERPGRQHSWCNTGHLRSHQPAHPFIQDPAMPPLPPPNTLAQLEEACRRLEEVSNPARQRYQASSLQRDRNHLSPLPSPGPQEEFREPKKPTCGQASELVVTYFFCGEEIPYRRMMKAQCLTLGHFKEQLRKKGNYRYYFKKASKEFDCGAVFEEIWDDSTVLPMYEGKVLGKVERVD
ncbi:AXIN2 protein, partial [Polypterus senegalus]|nr:axin-2 [Polypterus senegalus]XP_039598827.1 axin-2 [Polypterus senegalus]MBN3294340.1 AXIN2 protein [Polypterus senegalus]